MKPIVYAEDMEDAKMEAAIKAAQAAFDNPKTATSGKIFQQVANLIRV